MKKRANLFFIIVLTVLMIFAPAKNISKASSDIIRPMWNENNEVSIYIYNYYPYIEIETNISALENRDNIYATIYLQENEEGVWRNIKTWNVEDSGSLTDLKSFRTYRHSEYRAKVVAYVDGEKITAVSNRIDY